MYCGIDLSEDNSSNSHISFLGDEGATSHEVTSNEEIADVITEEKPELVAVNCALEERRKMSDGEEELKEEGMIFTPSTHDKRRIRRFEQLKRRVIASLDKDEIPEFIRFNEMISSKELAIDGDQALESYGIDSSEIESSGEFDALIGAITARFYQQGQFRDMDVIVPDSFREDDTQEVKKDPREGDEDEDIPGAGKSL